MFTIMVVEDDASSRRLMETVLTRGGYTVVSARDGVEALERMETHHIDLILLDVMLPRMDGFRFVRELRSADGGSMPVMMVTARETHEDMRRGFTEGIDDYMVKPVDEEELLWRIGALLRRARIASEHRLTVGSTVLDYDALCACRAGESVQLPQKEFRLLFKLLANPDKIFTRRALMDEIWGMDSDSDERTVDVHIGRLRERFRTSPDFEIVTVRGLGYKAVKR